MASRRRKRKSHANQGLFGVFVLFLVLVYAYPKAIIYVLIAGVIIAAVWLFLYQNKKETSHSTAIGVSNAQEKFEESCDLYPIWTSVTNSAKPEITPDRWSIELLDALEWKRFEIVCAKYFETQGFKAKTNRCGADGGVDIHLFKDGSQHPDVAVQCKAWSAYKVGVRTVRELLGVMTADRIGQGILITTGKYSSEARSFAEGKAITLFDGHSFFRAIQALPVEQQSQLLKAATAGDYTTPTCPSCGIKMTLRTNSRDESQFWGCVNYPHCHARFRYSQASA